MGFRPRALPFAASRALMPCLFSQTAEMVIVAVVILNTIVMFLPHQVLFGYREVHYVWKRFCGDKVDR